MSKKFKGKTCVYCCTPKSSQTGDHVFAREFFLPDRRNNLPQVPACERCNNGKSTLEHYLTAVMPFGGRHADATTNFENLAPRLEKNRKLFGQIAQKTKKVWINENGFTRLSMTLPFDAYKLGRLFCFIVKGLMWHHWNVLLDSNHLVRAGCLKEIGEQLFQSFFNFNASQRVNADLGDGTFRYEGVQGIGSPQFSLWKFSIYGGLKLAGVPNMPSEAPSLIWGITGRNEIISDLWDAPKPIEQQPALKPEKK